MISYYDQRGYKIKHEIDGYDSNRITIMVAVPWNIQNARTEFGGWECACACCLSHSEAERELESYLDKLDERNFALKRSRDKWHRLWRVFRSVRKVDGKWQALEFIRKNYSQQGSLILLRLVL